jgi:excisionase family DNA binding protein
MEIQKSGNSIIIEIPVDELIARVSETIIANLGRQLVPQITESKDEKHELLTRKETAAFLKISLVSLNKWTKEGKLPARRISGRIRYYREDVLKALKLISTTSNKK